MLHLDILKNITEEEIGKHNTGDNGLDLVGWYSFKDNAPGTMMTFAQCACGDDWEDKQIESHSFRWRNYIHFYNQPSNIIFFPRQYRKPDGSWLKTTTINDTVLIDRKRLLELFEKTQNSHFMPQYESIIDQVLKEKISDFD